LSATAKTPSRAPGAARAGRTGDWLGLPALALLIALAASGCGRRTPPPALPPDSPAQLVEWLNREPQPASLKGKGTLHLLVGRRGIPALGAQFALHPDRGAQLQLRPGLLSPVLALWAGEEDWCLRFPRQRVAFESGAHRGSTAEPVSAERLRSLGWFLFRPSALAARLQEPALAASATAWILRGVVRDARETVWVAELRVDPRSLGVAGWVVADESGEVLLGVEYDPPLETTSTQGRISFICRPLDAGGEFRFRGLEETAGAPPPRPHLPSGWRLASADRLQAFLEELAAEE